MLSFARRALTFEPETEIFLSIPDNHRLPISKLNLAGDLSIGLRLVLTDPSAKPHSAIVTVLQKPSNTLKSIAAPIGKESELGSFLTSCHLCKKPLKSGEDVYMYMGDQGFCSVACRTRRIAMDERKEVEEALDRRLLASGSSSSSAAASDSPKCPSSDQCETCRLLADLRQRRQRRKSARR